MWEEKYASNKNQKTYRSQTIPGELETKEKKLKSL